MVTTSWLCGAEGAEHSSMLGLSSFSPGTSLDPRWRRSCGLHPTSGTGSVGCEEVKQSLGCTGEAPGTGELLLASLSQGHAAHTPPGCKKAEGRVRNARAMLFFSPWKITVKESLFLMCSLTLYFRL